MNNVDFSTRRDFIKTSVSASGGLILTLSLPTNGSAQTIKNNDSYSIHSLVEIEKSGKIIIGLIKHEMGQGVDTGIPLIIADEMDANWDDVEVRTLDYDEHSRKLDFGPYPFSTGGSGSIEGNWHRYRIVGAYIRLLMRKAAAKQWEIDIRHCSNRNGFVFKQGSDVGLSYGELAESAAQLTYRGAPRLKNRNEFTLIGKSHNRVSSPSVVKGKYSYSIDEKVPGMLYASMERAPVKGGKIISVDSTKALKVPGVVDVVTIDASPSYDMWMTGAKNSVAVLAKSNWSAMQGRKALKIEWDHGPNVFRNSADARQEFSDKNKITTRERGEPELFKNNLNKADEILTAEYSTPYVAHALMEPLHAIAKVDSNNNVEVWAASQDPKKTADHISEELGITHSKILFHTRPSGGGFGRRYMFDYIIEAVLLAKKTRQTVSLLWTREDEIQHARFHPQRLDKFEIGLSKKGEILAFGFDGYATHPWGARATVPIHAKSQRNRSNVLKDLLVDYGSWRSVVRHLNFFSSECIIDELAHKLDKDPLKYRLELLEWPDWRHEDDPLKQRADARLPLKKVIVAAGKMAHWGRRLKKGVGLGIGAVKYKDTYCVQIAEVEATEKKFEIKKIWCAIECGLAVNPNQVKAQIEGSIIWALSPILHGGVDVKNGRVVQSNFDDHKKIRIHEIPEIEIQILESHRDPFGVGEPAVPPLAPAVYNAYFAATGKRVRSMPLIQP